MQPKQLDFYTAKVEEIYNHLNIRILETVTQRLAKGDRETITIPEWQINKLAETGQLTKETLKVIAEVAGKAPEEIENAIRQAGYATQKEVDSLMGGHRIIPSMNPMQILLTQYINRAKYNLDNLINETLMTRQGFGTVAQMYRDIVNKTAAEALTGVATLDQALQRTLNQWAEKGIPSGFVDKA
ncbi:phage minor capsid protein, partial [Herbiconiux daphne]